MFLDLARTGCGLCEAGFPKFPRQDKTTLETFCGFCNLAEPTSFPEADWLHAASGEREEKV